MRPALLVIGPSRSGSSALTSVLAMLGAALPANLIPPGPGNERGHFEPQRLMELNTTILAAHGIRYWDPIAIPPAWFASAEAAGFTTQIAATIAAEYAEAPLPVIKDPRLCRLAPLYLAACARLGLAPHAVIPLRAPAEAAASLSARDGTPAETAELLQVRELLGAERHTRSIPRAWASYDALLADWRATTTTIATTLHLTLTPPIDAGAGIDAFVAPALRHQLPATGTAGPLARRLHTAAATADETAIRAAFDGVRVILDEHDRLITPWQTTWRARLAALETQTHTLANELAQRDALLTAYETSISWRLTRPLRAFMHLLRP